MNPEITVVIPTFNRASTLPRCIESVQNQTFINWELLLVDDGSTDNTSQLVSKYQAEDHRIKYLVRDESRLKGANACRNIGIENAQGKYIALLDSDDYWKPKRLEQSFNFLEKNTKTDGIYSGGLIESSGSTVKKKSRNIFDNESAIDFLFSPDTWAPTPSMVFKNGLKVRLDECLKRHQDFDYFVRFHQKYKWQYFENYDVVVDRSESGIQKIDLASCLMFYDTNKKHISNRLNELNYLYSLYLQSSGSMKPLLTEKLHSISKYQTFRYKMLCYFPGIYSQISKAVNLINA